MSDGWKAYWIRFWADDVAPVVWRERDHPDRFFCSGEREETPNFAMLVLVHAASEDVARAAVVEAFPEALFDDVKEVPMDWRPGDRFPNARPLSVPADWKPAWRPTTPAPPQGEPAVKS